MQLDNFIDDIRQDVSFKGLNNLVDLSVKLVKTKRHKVYDMVYLLLKLVLLLSVATASVERVFSALTLVKPKLRNKLGDSLLDDCLVTFFERDIFAQVDEDDIIQTFMAFRNQRPDKKEEEPLNSCRYVTFFMHILDLANLFRLFIFNLCNIYI